MVEPLIPQAIRQIAAVRKVINLAGRLPGLRPTPLIKRCCWGHDFQEVNFLVIRRGEYGVGLFSLFMTTVAWLRYADEHNLVPVVDLKTIKNIYQRRRFWFRENAWEHFFDQPAGYDLDMIGHAKNVFVARDFLPEAGFLPSQWMDCETAGNREVDGWRSVVKKYIRVKPAPLDPFVNETLDVALSSGKGVLGVLARGTDYAKIRPAGHPVQPTCEQIFARIEELRQSGCSFKKIYLVTEDAEIARRFKDRYADFVILSKQQTIQYEGGYLAASPAVAHDIARGHGYLKAIVDLSRCDYLVAGRTSGAIGAILLSEGFKKVSLFDLGAY